MMPMKDLFTECTVLSTEHGYYEIKCKLGLWSIAGDKLTDVAREAFHYFTQYYGDGEYYELLGEERSPLPCLLRARA